MDIERLKKHEVRDSEFDQLYSRRYQSLSSRHWTPIQVAQVAGEWIREHRTQRVLDVGSGAGKFCLTVAGLCPDTTFVGVEQNLTLVREARTLAQKLNLPNVRFIHGDCFSLDWREFDLLYFYNPFLEPSEFTERCVNRTQDALASLPAGTKVLTYYGFGGDLPPDYSLQKTLPLAKGHLELWVR